MPFFKFPKRTEDKKTEVYFPGFAEPSCNISAFTFCVDVFVISLVNGTIVRHDPGDQGEAFRQWLRENEVREAVL